MVNLNRYVELAIREPRNRGLVIPLSMLPDYVRDAQAQGYALYRSYYTFDEEMAQHMGIRKTVRNFRGTYYLDRILLDIDKLTKQTDEQTLDRVRVFVKRLTDEYDIPTTSIHPWFSGSGWHVVIPDVFGFEPSETLPMTVRQTLVSLFPEADDIFDGARIIRVEQTVNHKTGLYKIPVTCEELWRLSAEDVKILAKQPRELAESDADESLVTKRFRHLIVHAPAEVHVPVPTDGVMHVVDCMQALYNRGPKEGSRHMDILRLASSFRRQGVPMEAIKLILKDWVPSLKPYDVDMVVHDCFTRDYRYGCHDPVMQSFCDQRCQFWKDKDFVPEVATPDSMEKRFATFAKSDYSKVSFDLNDVYDIGHKYPVMPGDFMVVFGDTGLGKTAWVQGLVVKLAHLRTLYLSLEVKERLLYRRFVQIAHNMTEEDVVAHYKHNDNTLSKAFDHIRGVFIPPTLEAIRKMVALEKPHIVVVDTTDSIRVEQTRTLEKEDVIALGLASLASQSDVIVIAVHHLSKAGANLGPLTVHSGKGSSTLEQKADIVIGIEGQQKSSLRVVSSLKARDAGFFRITCDQNPTTFVFTQRINHTHQQAKGALKV